MADNETIVDIIAKKRRRADELEASSYRPRQFLRERIAELRQEADRLEAARKHELSKNESKNGADFGQLGDCARLRETLENAAKELINATEDEDFGGDVMYLVGCMRAVSQKCRAVLDATEKEGGNDADE